MGVIFTEVMLNRVNFVEMKNDVKFEFYDATSGYDLGEVICKNIFAFNFHTTFEPTEECLPCLVLDVSSSKLEGDAIESSFRKLNYGYTYSDGLAIPKSIEYYLFKIEGGPIVVSIICTNIEVIKM